MKVDLTDSYAKNETYREHLRGLRHVAGILDHEEQVFGKIEDIGRSDLLRQSLATLDVALMTYRQAVQDLLDAMRDQD